MTTMNIHRSLVLPALAMVALLPAVAFGATDPELPEVTVTACASGHVCDLFGVADLFVQWIGLAAPLLVSLIVVVIFWNLGQFIRKAGDEKEREKYKQFAVWALVAMFLVVSFWGLVGLVANSFFGGSGNSASMGNPGAVDKNGVTITP